MNTTGTDIPPHWLGRYLLHTRLGVGGMAEVWLARQEGPAGFSKNLVVKKILPHLADDKLFIEMFLNEARLAARLNHPNVVQIFELGEDEGRYFMVMEFIAGRNLRAIHRDQIAAGKLIPVRVLAHLLIGVCEGLHYAHELCDDSGVPLKMVHRDVSPDNILVTFEGQAKVVDFGIAKAVAQATMARTGTLLGKFSYMSPEHAMGEPLDRRTDIYALGVVLYELLAGTTPFQSTNELAVLKAIVSDPPPSLAAIRPDVPKALIAIVERAMAKEQENRFPDARSMGQALAAWLRSCPEPTSTAEVADFMNSHFASDRNMLQRALSKVTKDPQRLWKRLPQSNKSGTGSQSIEKRPRRSVTTWASALIVLVASATVGAALVVLTSSMLVSPRHVRSSPSEQAGSPDAEASRDKAASSSASVATSGPTVNQQPEAPAGAPETPPDAGAPRAREAHVEPAVSAPPRPPGVAAKGRIVVRVNPWAEVTLDGKRVGLTPLAPIEVVPGKHRITLANSELGKTKNVTVDVRSRKDEIVRVDLLAE